MNNLIRLQQKYSTIAAIDLELLLAAVTHKTKEYICTHPEYRLSWLEKIKLTYFIYLRKKGYSIAAVTGHKEFFGLDFLVNKQVLIPRPDTELMVEEAMRILSYELETKNTNIVYIDVGTGSGCIPISIAKNLPKLSQIYAIDNSNQALKIAKKNAKKHKATIDFLHGNLLDPVLKKPPLLGTPCFLVITANLPYLTEAQFKSEPSIQREPKNALVANNNGLGLYEKLLRQMRRLPNFCQLSLFLEIGPSQTQAISQIIKHTLPTATFQTKKDLAGLDRLVIIQVNHQQ